MRAFDLNNGKEIAAKVEVADSFLSRMKGLLGRQNLPTGQALLITHCKSIHMFFMQFPIDVIFLDKKNTVVGIVNDIKPYQLSKTYWKASFALECPAGTIKANEVVLGDQISFPQ
jgi:uncharacterized membrane protein (UPF0127 family)